MSEIPAVGELLDLRGRVVLVTGSGSGLGAGIARRFAEAGADVAVHYRASAEGASAVAAEIRSLGRRAAVVQADVTEAAEVERLMVETVAGLGGLDVLVNNAGAYPLSSLEKMAEAEWDEVLAANLKSVFLCTRAAAARMKQAGGGAVVNIASIEGWRPAWLHSHYNAAKAGTLAHTRAAALELGGDGIRVNSVSPGLIWRQGIEEAWPEGVESWREAAPLGRMGTPADVADACLFLASSGARWITGADLRVDGGVLCRPAF